jgi:hypothetical protein
VTCADGNRKAVNAGLSGKVNNFFRLRIVTVLRRNVILNTRQHAQLAINLMLRHLESGYQPQTYADGKVDFILYSAENVD